MDDPAMIRLLSTICVRVSRCAIVVIGVKHSFPAFCMSFTSSSKWLIRSGCNYNVHAYTP